MKKIFDLFANAITGKSREQYAMAQRLWEVEYKNEPFDYVYQMILEGNVKGMAK